MRTPKLLLLVQTPVSPCASRIVSVSRACHLSLRTLWHSIINTMTSQVGRKWRSASEPRSWRIEEALIAAAPEMVMPGASYEAEVLCQAKGQGLWKGSQHPQIRSMFWQLARQGVQTAVKTSSKIFSLLILHERTGLEIPFLHSLGLESQNLKCQFWRTNRAPNEVR